MVYQRTKRGRLKQVTRWLRHRWPTEKPVRLIMVDYIGKGDSWAETRFGNKYNDVVLFGAKTRTMADLVDKLLHEWPHACLPVESADPVRGDHDEEWAIRYGEIYSEFVDHGGCEESLWF